MKTENLAIAFVDIAGYTPRTSAQTREENLQLLRRFDNIVRPVVRAFNGRVIKTIGDAFLLTFRSPTDAVLCSMALHDRLAESNRSVDASEQFTIRAAVNVGEVRIEGGDVFGEAVNIAARVEGKAGAGEIFFSESVFLSMTKSEVPHEEVGLAELKGIAGKVRLYRVPRAHEAEYAKGVAAADAGLPFGGYSLDRVREKLESSAMFAKLPDVVVQGTETATKSITWWKNEIRRSRVVQYGTVAVVILLVVAVIWTVRHKTHKTLTPMQKIQRTLGL
jgi:adenylate cyclase